MAAFARHRDVLPAQRIARALVIEPRLAHGAPALGRVAGGAGAAETSGVRILVAVVAARESHAAPLPSPRARRYDGRRGCRLDGVSLRRQCRVALRADDIPVPTGQREVRPGMIETGGPAPALQAVARAAVRPELAGVRIAVAGDTVGAQAQERALGIGGAGHERRPAGDGFRFVTPPAGRARVLPLQLPAGLCVVELGLAGPAPPDELIVAALVLHVTLLAGLVARLRVQSLLRADPRREGGVAGEAPVGGEFAPHFVAARAVLHPFEFLVRPVQRSGTQLRERRRGGRQRQENRRDARPKSAQAKCRMQHQNTHV